MDISHKVTTDLQDELMLLLKDLPGGYITGGTVLATHLGHRQSLDVDLFVTSLEAVDEAVGTLLRQALHRGWTVRSLQTSPGFRRFEVTAGNDQTLFDIVHEVVPQVVPVEDKPVRNGIRVDSLDDLIANKLCALLGRSDVKDLVDLYFVSESGTDVLDYLGSAHLKDGGMEPAMLAYVLRHMDVNPERLLLVKPVTEGALLNYREELVERLLEIAWPKN